MSITGITFLVAFFGGCALAFIRHPIFGLVTYVAVFYLHPPSRWWGADLPSLRWSFVAAVVTLLAVVIRGGASGYPPLRRQSVFVGGVLFFLWLLIQAPWALDSKMHLELIDLTFKYLLLLYLIYRCIDSEQNLRLFLWAHVLGCFYLGVIAFENYGGGRFEGFGGPAINEANAGALQIVTGIVCAGALFLSGRFSEKVGVVGLAPIIVNGVVVTVSRSGFLALGVAGLLFNLLSPRRYARFVRICSILALLLFLALTNPLYWSRISTITKAGEQVEGVDTGAGRLVLMQAQLRMASDWPLGCGHRCTAVLSPDYLEDRYLTGRGENRARSSHNTALSLLVEQGVPGFVMYILLVVWTARLYLRTRPMIRQQTGLVATAYAATISALVAIMIGDMFVDYLKSEVRIWFLGLAMVLANLLQEKRREAKESEPARSNVAIGAYNLRNR